MRLLLLFALAILPCLAADDTFNGRWNIKVINEPRNRAWWLEVTGAGAGGPMKGRFVGAPGGDMNDIADLSVRNGELNFTFDRGNQHLVYRARLEGDELHGSFDNGKDKMRWVGKRAPKILDKDDGSWREGTPVKLFNGKNLDGWLPLVPGKELGWLVSGGILKNEAAANNLISKEKFWNFALHAEYRIPAGSNSGIGLRARYEIQILEDFGKPPNSHGNGALYSRIVPSVNASRPPGEWQTMDIRLVGRQVTVVLNGRKVIDKGEVEGLTAVASDPDESAPGPITLQGDHKEVEFRAVVITPLTK